MVGSRPRAQLPAQPAMRFADPVELCMCKYFESVSRAWTVWTDLSACSLLTFADSKSLHTMGLACGGAAIVGLPLIALAWNGAARRVVEAGELARQLFARTAPRGLAKANSKQRIMRRLRALPPAEVDKLAAASEAERKVEAAGGQLRLALALFMLQVLFTVGCWVSLAVSSSWIGGLLAVLSLAGAVSCRAICEARQLLPKACALTSAAVRLCTPDEVGVGPERGATAKEDVDASEYAVYGLIDEMRRALPSESGADRWFTAAALGGIWWLLTLLSAIASCLTVLAPVSWMLGVAGVVSVWAALRKVGLSPDRAVTAARLCGTARRAHTPEMTGDFGRTAGQLVAAARYGLRAASVAFGTTILALPLWLLSAEGGAQSTAVKVALLVPLGVLLVSYARELPISEAARRVRDARVRLRRLESTYCPDCVAPATDAGGV